MPAIPFSPLEIESVLALSCRVCCCESGARLGDSSGVVVVAVGEFKFERLATVNLDCGLEMPASVGWLATAGRPRDLCIWAQLSVRLVLLVGFGEGRRVRAAGDLVG